MDMNFFESCLYGLFSGLAEFLPVSPEAHQVLLRQLFGIEGKLPLLNLLVHIGVLLAVFYGGRDTLRRLHREYQLRRMPRKRRRRPSDTQSAADLSLLKTALLPLLLGVLIYIKSQNWQLSPHIVAPLLFLNGILLYIPMYLPSGNKDARSMSPLDGLLIGFAAMLAVFPGISRIAATTSVATARGAEPQHGYRWGMLLAIPALAVLILFDLIAIVTVGLEGVKFIAILQYLTSGVTAFIGAYLSIMLARNILQKTGIFVFSYYCWGAAIFTFILYLI